MLYFHAIVPYWHIITAQNIVFCLFYIYIWLIDLFEHTLYVPIFSENNLPTLQGLKSYLPAKESSY